MGKKKKKGEKKTKLKKYTPKVSREERIKQISQIQNPDLDKQFIKENESKLDHFRPTWRNDRRSLAEQRRVKQKHNRPKKPRKKIF